MHNSKYLKRWELTEDGNIIAPDLYCYYELQNIDNQVVAEIYHYSFGSWQGTFFPPFPISKTLYKEYFDDLKYSMNQILINHGFIFLSDKELLLI
jgi:hypothetical protein